jgi:phage terminase small subunit|tara:strand:- start:87 stop:728 length:642 start_codon:yes stop_codon:yes gene_type:complete
MGLPKKLTEKQVKFVNELISNEGRITATEAAIRAGYEKDFARQRASELQNPKYYPLVVQHMGALREEYQKKYAVTFERHITELGKIRQAAVDKGAWSAAVNAEVARGKAAGLYVEQKIIRTGKLEDLSAEELENRMKEILEEYSPILEGVEVQELTKEVKQRQKKSRLQPKENKPIIQKQTFDYSESESYQPSESESSSSPLKSSSPSKSSSS